MSAMSSERLVGGLCYPEAPRWHDGRLWLSDQHDRSIVAITPAGDVEIIERFDDSPSGLGWLDDGTMLAVMMHDHTIVRVGGGSEAVHADLSGRHGGPTNDMVVAGNLVYVGNIGFDFYAGEELSDTVLLRVGLDGAVEEAAAGMVCPNGMAISPDRRRLYVAESLAGRISMFRIDEDGGLHDREVFAELADQRPDGICLDAEGMIWAACSRTPEVWRVAPGGDVVGKVVSPDNHAYACALGGDDRRTLFVCTSPTDIPEEAVARRAGAVEACRVDVPGVGWN